MPKKLFWMAAAAAGLILGAASGAQAADILYGTPPAIKAPAPAPIPVDVLFSLTATTDYISRGASQTDHGPALQGSIEFDLYQFYASLWASNVKGLTYDEDVETDWAIGWRPTLGPVNLDLGWVYYAYLPNGSEGDNFSEAYIKASINPVEPLTLGAAFFINPDNSATYIEANAAYALPYNFKISGAVGAVNAPSGDYVAWNAGVSYTWNDSITLDARYWDASSNCFDTVGNQCDARVVGSITFNTSAKKLGLIH